MKKAWTARMIRTGAVTLATAMAAGIAYRFYRQSQERAREAVAPAAGIQILEDIEIRGTRQWIRIRGVNRANPVLLFVHGGPGFPQMPFAAAMRKLEDDFVVVHWDERGAGKSFRFGVPSDEMRVDEFAADLHAVVGLVLARFRRPKLLLVAHSWGTIFSAIEVSRHPELYSAYVGVGQIAHYPENEKDRYDFALAEALKDRNDPAVAELRKIGRPPHVDMASCHVMDKWVSFFSKREFTGVPASEFATLAFASPDYSWTDLARIPLGFRFSYAALWREVYYEVDLFRQAPRINAPVYFFGGKFDRIAQVAQVRRYAAALDAPAGKEVVVFEHSAHWPFFEEPERFARELRRIAAAQP